jgi:hypothetical protein
LYLRPTKRRGPQKGYRTALNTFRESAAAWGAVLGAIPGLDALIEGHLRANGGEAIIASIKDSNQQDALITKWQQSSVFRTFFGYNGSTPGQPTLDSSALIPSQDVEDEDARDETPSVVARPAKRLSQQPARQRSQSVSSLITPDPKLPPSLESQHFQPRDLLSDLVAKDAAQSYDNPQLCCPLFKRIHSNFCTSATRASETLASLGFAPDETIADFYTMGSNPEPIPEPHDPDFDPSLGTEAEQRAYYELLMGRSFPG